MLSSFGNDGKIVCTRYETDCRGVVEKGNHGLKKRGRASWSYAFSKDLYCILIFQMGSDVCERLHFYDLFSD